MVILNGDAEGMERALQLVLDNPNPAHLKEDRLVNGCMRSIAAMLNDSFAVTAVAGYALTGDEAMLGGVTLEPAEGLFKHQIWMLATAGAVRHPKWLLREGRHFFKAADRHFRWPHGYVQAIPSSYREGVNFALHMGFRISRTIQHGEGGEIAVMERMIPRWVQ